MKRICAWCGKTMNNAESPDTGKVTHGLCEECRKSVLVEPRRGEESAGATTNEPANGLNMLAKPGRLEYTALFWWSPSTPSRMLATRQAIVRIRSRLIHHSTSLV